MGLSTEYHAFLHCLIVPLSRYFKIPRRSGHMYHYCGMRKESELFDIDLDFQVYWQIR